jgi:hypothetical protein
MAPAAPIPTGTGTIREFAVEWIKNYVNALLPTLYRDKNAEAIDRLGYFLKAS